MKVIFKGKKITGVLGVLPEEVHDFDDEISNYPFPEKQTRRLKKVMGFDKHRISKQGSTTSDFCLYGIRYLFETGKIDKSDIGAVVVITASPDYLMPHVSNIIHGELDLDKDVICLDVPQGCCGFLYGLMLSCNLLSILGSKKVVLFNSDVLSHRISTKDRSGYPLTGDATAITIIENDETADDIYIRLCVDGKNRNALIIPAGGFAMPSNEETRKEKLAQDGNIRSAEHLYMNGDAVFDFVYHSVPPIMHEMFEELSISNDDIDYFLLHQPNKFLLSKLADEMEFPYEKTFMNITENIGNPHGASIPINMAFNLGEKLVANTYKCCMSAFGAGLAYGVAVTCLGNMDFCELIESNL